MNKKSLATDIAFALVLLTGFRAVEKTTETLASKVILAEKNAMDEALIKGSDL